MSSRKRNQSQRDNSNAVWKPEPPTQSAPKQVWKPKPTTNVILVPTAAPVVPAIPSKEEIERFKDGHRRIWVDQPRNLNLPSRNRGNAINRYNQRTHMAENNRILTVWRKRGVHSYTCKNWNDLDHDILSCILHYCTVNEWLTIIQLISKHYQHVIQKPFTWKYSDLLLRQSQFSKLIRLSPLPSWLSTVRSIVIDDKNTLQYIAKYFPQLQQLHAIYPSPVFKLIFYIVDKCLHCQTVKITDRSRDPRNKQKVLRRNDEDRLYFEGNIPEHVKQLHLSEVRFNFRQAKFTSFTYLHSLILHNCYFDNQADVSALLYNIQNTIQQLTILGISVGGRVNHNFIPDDQFSLIPTFQFKQLTHITMSADFQMVLMAARQNWTISWYHIIINPILLSHQAIYIRVIGDHYNKHLGKYLVHMAEQYKDIWQYPLYIDMGQWGDFIANTASRQQLSDFISQHPFLSTHVHFNVAASYDSSQQKNGV